MLDGHATIVYRSGADSALPSIHLQTYPNAFATGRDAEHASFEVHTREGERACHTRPTPSRGVEGTPVFAIISTVNHGAPP